MQTWTDSKKYPSMHEEQLNPVLPKEHIPHLGSAKPVLHAKQLILSAHCRQLGLITVQDLQTALSE